MGKIADNLTNLGRFLLLIVAAVFALATTTTNPLNYQASAQRLGERYDQLQYFREDIGDRIEDHYHAAITSASRVVTAPDLKARLAKIRVLPRQAYVEDEKGGRWPIPLEPRDIRVMNLTQLADPGTLKVVAPTYELDPNDLRSVLATLQRRSESSPKLAAANIQLVVSDPPAPDQPCHLSFQAPSEPGKRYAGWGNGVRCRPSQQPLDVTDQFHSYFVKTLKGPAHLLTVGPGYGQVPYLDERQMLEQDTRDQVKKERDGGTNSVVGVTVTNEVFRGVTPLLLLFLLLLMISDTQTLRTLPKTMHKPEEAVHWLAQFGGIRILLPIILYGVLPALATAVAVDLFRSVIELDSATGMPVASSTKNWFDLETLFVDRFASFFATVAVAGAAIVFLTLSMWTRKDLLQGQPSEAASGPARAEQAPVSEAPSHPEARPAR